MFTGVGFGFFRVYMTPSDALGVRFTFSGLRFSKRRRFIIDNRVFIGFSVRVSGEHLWGLRIGDKRSDCLPIRPLKN